MSLPKGVLPPSKTFSWNTIDLDVDLLHLLHGRVEQDGNQYGLGDKVDIDADSTEVRDSDVDCSGYVRWLIYRATKNQFDIKDGSYIQHDYVKELKFKISSVESAKAHDGVVRIAFLAPGKIGKIGHVALIHNGQTIESHGGTGPDSRVWDGARWQAYCDVYVLYVPKDKA